MLSKTGDPFPEFLRQRIAVFVAFSAVKDSNPGCCPAGGNVDSTFKCSVHVCFPDGDQADGCWVQIRLEFAERRIFSCEKMFSTLQKCRQLRGAHPNHSSGAVLHRFHRQRWAPPLTPRMEVILLSVSGGCNSIGLREGPAACVLHQQRISGGKHIGGSRGTASSEALSPHMRTALVIPCTNRLRVTTVVR